MGDYCRKFAARGYVCFAIDYRLAPEEPIPSRAGYTEDDIDMAGVAGMLNRVDLVRGIMGLKNVDSGDPEDIKVIVDAVLAAIEDLRNAVDHAHNSAAAYNVDPEPIVLGEFSAGP